MVVNSNITINNLLRQAVHTVAPGRPEATWSAEQVSLSVLSIYTPCQGENCSDCFIPKWWNSSTCFLELLNPSTLHRFRKAGNEKNKKKIHSSYPSKNCQLSCIRVKLNIRSDFYSIFVCSPFESFHLIKARRILNDCILLTPGQLWCPKPIPISSLSLPIGSEEINNEMGARPREPIVD